MEYNFSKSLQILERTPAVLDTMLRGISDDWTTCTEGADTWSPYDIIGHLIHGEKTDWMPRLRIILSNQTDKTFTPFDRFAQFTNSKGKSLSQLLDEFTKLRKNNLDTLRSYGITEDLHNRTGIHPAFGNVKLSELLATWVVHDLNHIAQVCRVMAKQYKEEVGPWVEYLRILQQ